METHYKSERHQFVHLLQIKCIHPFLLNATTLISAFEFYSTENSEDKAIFPKQKSPTKVTPTPTYNGSFQN